ncbi:MAG: AAA family ATPase [Lentisphaerales bacterium]|nr:AAA family ATPase [Lentisphaerales bacterium]
MQREAIVYLQEWRQRSSRRPLIIRGARQVGKSWLAKQFGRENFQNFIETNFDEKQQLDRIFEKDINECLNLLEIEFDTEIKDGDTLIFLDEVQAAPEVFARLRYFYENRPGLHIIATGSLLEFLLANHSFSMPVVRIEYMYLLPFNFREFLMAANQQRLLNFMLKYQLGDELPESIHQKIRRYFLKFLYLGAMPESIKSWIESGNFRQSEIISQSLKFTATILVNTAIALIYCYFSKFMISYHFVSLKNSNIRNYFLINVPTKSSKLMTFSVRLGWQQPLLTLPVTVCL